MKRRFRVVALLSISFLSVGMLGGCGFFENLFFTHVSASWGDTAQAYRERVGEEIRLEFPAGGTPGSVWGTDIYTDNSDIGTAAVHAGMITFEDGGKVIIEIMGGQDSFQGSTRHGVTSEDYGYWPGSFRFVPYYLGG